MRTVILGIWIAISIIACNDTPSVPPLAVIERITPKSVEPGDELRIHGTGFVEGDVELVLTGTFRVNGPNRPKHRTVRLHGTAVSETAVEVPLSPTAMRKLADEPSAFNGAVQLNFPISSEAVRLFAEIEKVRLDITPGGAGVATHARKMRDAEALLGALGIRLASAVEVDGLVAAEIAEGSPAERAGIEFGDRLLAVDDRALSTVTDLADTSAKRPHTLDIVTRQGILKKVTVLPPSAGMLDGDEISAVMLSAAALGLFLAFVAPSTRRRIALDFKGPDPFTRALGIAVISLFLCLVPAAALFLYGGTLLWLALFAVHAAGVITVYLKAPKRRFPALLQLLTVPTLAAAAAGLSAAVSPTEIVAAQSGGALGAHVFRSPFTMLLGAVALLTLSPARRADYTDHTTAVFSQLSAAAAASTVSICLLGGWYFPILSELAGDGTVGGALACLVFPLKTWAVVAASRRLTLDGRDRRAAAPTREPYLPALLMLLLAGASLAWEMPMVPDAARSIGRIPAAAMFTAVAAAILGTALRAVLGDNIRKNERRASSADPASLLSQN